MSLHQRLYQALPTKVQTVLVDLENKLSNFVDLTTCYSLGYDKSERPAVLVNNTPVTNVALEVGQAAGRKAFENFGFWKSGISDVENIGFNDELLHISSMFTKETRGLPESVAQRIGELGARLAANPLPGTSMKADENGISFLFGSKHGVQTLTIKGGKLASNTGSSAEVFLNDALFAVSQQKRPEHIATKTLRGVAL
jgi:hypothetical protein